MLNLLWLERDDEAIVRETRAFGWREYCYYIFVQLLKHHHQLFAVMSIDIHMYTVHLSNDIHFHSKSAE